MGLYKKEVLIRTISTITVEGAKNWAKNWINDHFQDADKNKDDNGKYIDYFFADIFDARDKNLYRVFSDACEDKYDMGVLEFDVIDSVAINKRFEELENRPVIEIEELVNSLINNDEFIEKTTITRVETMLTDLKISFPKNMLKCEFISNDLNITLKRSDLKVTIIEGSDDI